MSFDEYNKWMTHLKKLRVFEYLSMFFYVFFKPHKFFDYYNQLSPKAKWCQLLTYLTLYGVCLFLFTNYSEFKVIARSVILDSVTIIMYAGVIAFILYIIKPVSHKKIIFRSLVYFFYLRLLFIIADIVLYKTFVESERYVFLYLSSLIDVIILPYVIISIPLIFLKKGKKRVLYYLYSFALFNVFIFCLCYVDSQSVTLINRDIIAQERSKLGRKIKNTYVIPTMVAQHENILIGDEYLYSEILDNSANKTYIDHQYVCELRSDIDTISNIVDQCRFNINRDFFQKLYLIKRNILYIHTNKHYSDRIYKETVVIGQNHNKIDKITYRYYSDDIPTINAELFMEDFKLSEKYEIAKQIIRIEHLAFPILFYIERLELEK